VLYASICINNPSETANILQDTPNPEANISAGSKKKGSRSALMTLHQIHVYNGDVFIDHAQWRYKNEKVARIELLALNAWSPLLLKRPSEVR
jgi:hypothetical protein